MSIERILICIFIMAVVTYIPRMLPLTLMHKKIHNRFISSFLYYTPYAVLAAMTFPAILYSTGSVISALIGLIVGLLLSFKGRGLLKVALFSACAVFIAEILITYI